MAVTLALTFLGLILLVAAYRHLMRPWFVAGTVVRGLSVARYQFTQAADM